MDSTHNVNSTLWSRGLSEIMWETKTIISPLPQCLWPPNVVSSHNVTIPFGHVVLRDHATNWNHMTTTTVPMATTLGRMVTNLKWILPIMLTLPFGPVVFQRSCEKLKPLYLHYHSVCGHQTWFLPIMLLYPLVTWSCETTRQTEIIWPLPQCLRPPNLAGWWLVFRGSYP